MERVFKESLASCWNLVAHSFMYATTLGKLVPVWQVCSVRTSSTLVVQDSSQGNNITGLGDKFLRLELIQNMGNFLKGFNIQTPLCMLKKIQILTWACFLVCIQHISHSTLAVVWGAIVDTNMLAVMSLRACIWTCKDTSPHLSNSRSVSSWLSLPWYSWNPKHDNTYMCSAQYKCLSSSFCRSLWSYYGITQNIFRYCNNVY